MKKANKRELADIAFRVLDTRKINSGVEIEVEIVKKNEKGIAILKLYGPNAKKGCTILINKAKNNDEIFVKILADEIIKPLIDNFISGAGWAKLMKIGKKSAVKCKICNKIFCSDINVKIHIEKYRTDSFTIKCDDCNYTSNRSILVANILLV